MRVAVLTVSDRSFHGEREDKAGPAVAEAIGRLVSNVKVVERTILPDERDDIEWNLKRIADTGAADVILTTGGTGLASCDVMPQATLAVVEFEVPGLPEAMRASTRPALPAASLSRAAAGVRGRTLILNLPGSPRGAVECLEAVAEVLPHAVATLRGEAGDAHPARVTTA